jgi:hypothetical protein
VVGAVRADGREKDVGIRGVLAAAGVIAAALSPGCDGGPGDATLEFDTTIAVEEAVGRTSAWYNRNGFEMYGVTVRQVNGEKRRPLASGGGQQIDVLIARFKVEPAFTHVEITSFTDLEDEHGRRRAGQVSDEARADAQALARELMAPPPG